MESRPLQREDRNATAKAIELARREPGRVLAWILGLHLILWTLLPILLFRNLQLDLVEDLALGKEWQLGYWKHPPLPWWTADLAFRVAGDVRVVYLLGPLASVIAMYAVWRLGRQTVSSQNALIAVLVLEGLHFLNFSAVKFNHDVMQLPFWALTGLFFFRAVTYQRLFDWILSGAWLAFAFWTKYTAFALVVPIGLMLLIDSFARRTLATAGPYLMAGAFLIVIGPHVWWLIEHDFMPFHHVAARAKMATHWYEYLWFPLRWIGSQLFFLAPALALLALLLADSRRSEPADDPAAAFSRRYVTMLALGPFIFTTLVAALSGRLAIAMWGYPLWLFAPLAALMWFAPVTDTQRLRLFAHAFVLVFLAMPAAYAAVEIFEPYMRDRPKATEFPGRLLAETITREWREQTGTPLTYVAGVELGSSGVGEFAANNVAVYSPDRPHVVVHGDSRLSPWIDIVDLKRRGAVVVWQKSSLAEAMPDGLLVTHSRAEVRPPLVLPRQTPYPRNPVTIGYAFVRPEQ